MRNIPLGRYVLIVAVTFGSFVVVEELTDGVGFALATALFVSLLLFSGVGEQLANTLSRVARLARG